MLFAAIKALVFFPNQDHFIHKNTSEKIRARKKKMGGDRKKIKKEKLLRYWNICDIKYVLVQKQC